MDLTSEFQPFQDRLTSSLLSVTRTAGQVSAEDLSFHRSASASLSRTLDAQNSRLLQLNQRLLKAARAPSSNIAAAKLQDAEDVDENWRSIIDVVDDLLERADASLDEYTGVIKRLSPSAQDGVSTTFDAKDNKSKKFPSIFSQKQLAKPQLLFERAHRNHDAGPFKPLLRTKPHSLLDLEESIGQGGPDGYKHPYAAEIERYSYPPTVHSPADPLPYSPPADSEAIFVETKEGVEEMLAELREASEIAIDLEHHDIHSYVGIVCLMQISTRKKDWIIDTLVPWREDLQVLNEVFADPKILKVFQGSTMDMIWLQRDLGLYIVGLFDTFHASTALGFPQKSLKYLLERFCNFQAKKKYQMADWRVRPLPEEMVDYARSDTHYLLFIYDHLRNMLLEASTPDHSLIDYVLEGSKKEALQRYERAEYDADKGLGPVGWLGPLARRSVYFTPEQLAVYRAVHEWRDGTARTSDEGPMFVMNQATLFAVAEAMPTTVPALIRVTNPVSKAIKEASHELVELIKKGKDAGRGGPTVADVMRENEAFLPRSRYSKRQLPREPADPGLGATLQLLNNSGEVSGKADRTFTSRLWGAVAKPLLATATRFSAPLTDAVRLMLPLPDIEAGSFTDPAQPTLLPQAAEASATTTSPPLPASAEQAGSSNVFVLKHVDRSAKRNAASADPDDDSHISPPSNGHDANNADSSSPASPALEASVTGEGKARRRERKRRKKEALGEAIMSDGQVQPFDYANADSVWGGQVGKHVADGAAEAPGLFNPYAKALDGPQGRKRVRKEAAGRSFTFKR